VKDFGFMGEHICRLKVEFLFKMIAHGTQVDFNLNLISIWAFFCWTGKTHICLPRKTGFQRKLRV